MRRTIWHDLGTRPKLAESARKAAPTQRHRGPRARPRVCSNRPDIQRMPCCQHSFLFAVFRTPRPNLCVSRSCVACNVFRTSCSKHLEAYEHSSAAFESSDFVTQCIRRPVRNPLFMTCFERHALNLAAPAATFRTARSNPTRSIRMFERLARTLASLHQNKSNAQIRPCHSNLLNPSPDV